MNILTKIKGLKNLTYSEKCLVDYLLKYPDTVLDLTAAQLANKCKVSTPSLYRLCNKLDLNGYSDLKVKLSISLKDYIVDDDFNFNFPVSQDESYRHLLKILQEDYQKTIQFTNNLFDIKELSRVVNAIKKANVIDVYTSSGNIFFAQNFAFQMKEIGININVPVDEYIQRLTASSSDSTHLSIVISFGGRGLLVNQILNILKDKGSKVLLISSNEFDIHHYKIDYHLYMCEYEDHYNKISSYSTRLTLLYILDVIYTAYFQLEYDKNIKKKLEYYKYISKKY